MKKQKYYLENTSPRYKLFAESGVRTQTALRNYSSAL